MPKDNPLYKGTQTKGRPAKDPKLKVKVKGFNLHREEIEMLKYLVKVKKLTNSEYIRACIRNDYYYEKDKRRKFERNN